jgi:beta-mannosidase
MIEQFTLPGDRYRNSSIINAHQKASNGFDKIDHYLNRYFIDSPRLAKLSFEDYNYLTQCMQYYILKNSIAVHRSKAPNTMGTLLWQLNDCWPVSSWSITDYNREPKAAWYAVKEAYRDDALPKEDSVYPKDLGLKPPKITIDFKENYFIVSSDVDTKYVYLHSSIPGIIFSENYFDLKAGQKIKITPSKKLGGGDVKAIRVRSLFDVINN